MDKAHQQLSMGASLPGTWHTGRCQQLVALRILVPNPGLGWGAPHINSRVTPMGQAPTAWKAQQLAPCAPPSSSSLGSTLPSPAPAAASRMGWGCSSSTDKHTDPAPGPSLAQRPPLAGWLQAHQGGPPPPAACPPAATFAQLCLVFSCLPSFGGGGAWGCEHCPHLGLGQRSPPSSPKPRAGG